MNLKSGMNVNTGFDHHISKKSYCRNREVFMELTRGSTQYKSTAINANPSET